MSFKNVYATVFFNYFFFDFQAFYYFFFINLEKLGDPRVFLGCFIEFREIYRVFSEKQREIFGYLEF